MALAMMVDQILNVLMLDRALYRCLQQPGIIAGFFMTGFWPFEN